jgi:hypothetical protein
MRLREEEGQRDQCTLFSVVFNPSHYGSVWVLPVFSLLLTNTALHRGCGLAYPYDGRGFVGLKKKMIVGLLVFNSFWGRRLWIGSCNTHANVGSVPWIHHSLQKSFETGNATVDFRVSLLDTLWIKPIPTSFGRGLVRGGGGGGEIFFGQRC